MSDPTARQEYPSWRRAAFVARSRFVLLEPLGQLVAVINDVLAVRVMINDPVSGPCRPPANTRAPAERS